jgi:hypothetical protein
VLLTGDADDIAVGGTVDVRLRELAPVVVAIRRLMAGGERVR